MLYVNNISKKLEKNAEAKKKKKDLKRHFPKEMHGQSKKENAAINDISLSTYQNS